MLYEIFQNKNYNQLLIDVRGLIRLLKLIDIYFSQYQWKEQILQYLNRHT